MALVGDDVLDVDSEAASSKRLPHLDIGDNVVDSPIDTGDRVVARYVPKNVLGEKTCEGIQVARGSGLILRAKQTLPHWMITLGVERGDVLGRLRHALPQHRGRAKRPGPPGS